MMDKDRLCLHTIWFRDEAYQRLNRLADRLDISKSEVIIAALKLYEDGLNAVEAHTNEIDEGFRRASAASLGLISDFEKLNQGLVRLGEDVGEPIDPERLRELLGTRPDDCPAFAMNNRREFIFEPKK